MQGIAGNRGEQRSAASFELFHALESNVNEQALEETRRSLVSHRDSGPLRRCSTSRAFRDNGIDEAVLPHLTVEDLKELGVATVGDRVEQLIKAAGAELRYLPAYSPDMNPIEKAFSKLKAFLRKLAERTVAGLMRALENCAQIFKPSECTNYFKFCGYQDDTG